MVLPSLRALQMQTPEAGIPLDPEPFLKALCSDPERARRLGYFGFLDDAGRAVAEVTVPSGVGPGSMLGFAFATAPDGPGLLEARTFSNDVWVRIEGAEPMAASFEGSGARALPETSQR